jgi:hypothetical protein
VGPHYVATLDDVERTILAGVVADTAILLGARWAEGALGEAEPATDPLDALDWDADRVESPSDPALARLLPEASREDAELAAEFRRLTEGSLRRGKVANLRVVWTALRMGSGPLAVPRAEAPRWASALTDVRLVLAARLGIETEEDADRVHDVADGLVPVAEEDVEAEVQAALASLYSALTWLQESLLQAMLDDGAPRGGRRAGAQPGG